MKYYKNEYKYVYRMQNGYGKNVKYVFKIAQRSISTWVSYIISTPKVQNRDMSTSITHRVYDSQKGLYYISWNCPVKSPKDMELISNKWAELFQRYIDKGILFGN